MSSQAMPTANTTNNKLSIQKTNEHQSDIRFISKQQQNMEQRQEIGQKALTKRRHTRSQSYVDTQEPNETKPKGKLI